MRLCSAGCASCKVGFHKAARGVAGTGPRGDAHIALDLDRGMIVAAFEPTQARDSCCAGNLPPMPQHTHATALPLPAMLLPLRQSNVGIVEGACAYVPLVAPPARSASTRMSVGSPGQARAVKPRSRSTSIAA